MASDLSTVPLIAISAKTKQCIANMLNPTKVLPSDYGLARDWRGLVQDLMEHNAEIMPLLTSQSNPTIYILTMLEKDEKNITIKNFQTTMEQMDRWDVIDETKEMLESDVAKYLEHEQRAQVSADPVDEHVDREVLTLDDICRLRQGLKTAYYDAFLLYADEDINFVKEIVRKLEMEYKLKLCLKDRDLVGGIEFEHEAVMKLISDRCNRLLIIVSPSFLKSPANKFVLNYTQALSIEQKRQRKIVPCLYKNCELPVQLRYISNIDYNRRGIYDFWSKLRDSIQAPNSVIISNVSSVELSNITQEITEINNTLPDKHSDITETETNEKTSQETLKDLQKSANYAMSNVNDTKVLNVSNEKNKKSLLWEITNWMTKTKQNDQFQDTETTIPHLPSVNNLDSLNLSSADIYEDEKQTKKKKKLFGKKKVLRQLFATKKGIAIQT